MYTHRTGDQHPNLLTNFPDNKGWTPLHYACYDNNTKLVLQLIKAGADPNARYDFMFLWAGCGHILIQVFQATHVATKYCFDK